MKKPIPKIHKEKGFTLLETLVAIFILTLSITGPVYIASVAFHNTIDSRDNISAQYIAEEVVEVIRNKRDKYTLINADASAWLTNIMGNVNCVNDEGNVINKCIVMRDTSIDESYTFETCSSDGCQYISFDPEEKDPEGNGAVYGKARGTTFSKFKREFYFETSSNRPGEAVLTVNIKWEDKGRPKIYTLTERLYSINYKGFFKPDAN